MGLSTIGEGCKRQMEPMIEDVVDNILPFLQDPVSYLEYVEMFSESYQTVGILNARTDEMHRLALIVPNAEYFTSLPSLHVILSND